MTKEHSEQIAAMGFTSEEMQRSKTCPRGLREDFSQYKVPEEEIAAEKCSTARVGCTISAIHVNSGGTW